jgi:Holliday junction DNA helicase RuvA
VLGRLRGVVVDRSLDGSCIVDVGGVGYEVFVPVSALSRLPAPPEECTLFVHTHAREDALALYGFAAPEDREAFRIVMGVSGVGPKLAMAILGALPAKDLAGAIARQDAAAFKGISGVGKKLTERLLLELADKLGHLVTSTSIASPVRASGKVAPRVAGPLGDVARILVSLGYKPAEAERAVSLIDAAEGRPIEELVREALAHAT